VASAFGTYDSCCVSAAASLAAADTVIAYITLDDRPNISSLLSLHGAKRRGGLYLPIIACPNFATFPVHACYLWPRLPPLPLRFSAVRYGYVHPVLWVMSRFPTIHCLQKKCTTQPRTIISCLIPVIFVQLFLSRPKYAIDGGLISLLTCSVYMPYLRKL